MRVRAFSIPWRRNSFHNIDGIVTQPEDLRRSIALQLISANSFGRRARDAQDHEAFAETRRRTYIGRPEYFEALDQFAVADGSPLALLGDPAAANPHCWPIGSIIGARRILTISFSSTILVALRTPPITGR